MQIKGKFSVVQAIELKLSDRGNEWGRFRVAYNERVKDTAGNWGDLMWPDAKNNFDTVSEFYEVIVFAGSDAFTLAKDTLTKGDFVEITGRRSLRGYVKDGVRHTAQSIVAESITMVTTKGTIEPALAEPAPMPF
jgi:single-stranded DNA-binding protein